ncbi:Ankyrin repeat domain-containing protein 50 [Fusarium oxysporum f. sp. cubense]|uniref:Ankyrin repeat domain-containing protein 50 n=1 Tax=Fusarium oxysporum f. sp. cubense TaxID=61366 RepID=A0A559KRM1_FUSOC|nr:Ankyrin repeat domain-containing protein 50 [Fusarium oxysporum f. sp. cubense]
MFGLFTSFCEVRRQVAKSLTLNRRQSIAFWLICRQLDQVRRDEHCTAQLCLFIGGNGGTGKSRVIAAIAAIAELFALAISPETRVREQAAPSSSAGLRIDGQAKMDWQEKYALIIDEVGMLGARMLYAVNVQLRRLRESTEDFGDIPVIIFFGDCHQFRPVQEWSILLPSSSFPRGQGHGFGLEQQRQHDVAYALWRMITVVVLKKKKATLTFQRQRHAPLHIFVSEHKWKDGKPTEEEGVMMLGQGDDSAISVPAVFMFVPGMPVVVNQNMHQGLKRVNGARYEAVRVVLDKAYPGHRINADTVLHFGPPAVLLLASETTSDLHFVGMPAGIMLFTPVSVKIEDHRYAPSLHKHQLRSSFDRLSNIDPNSNPQRSFYSREMLHLVNEHILSIATHLESERDINAFARTNHRLFSCLNIILYHRNIQQSESSAVLWAAVRGREQTARRAIEFGCGRLNEALTLSAKNGHEELTKVLLAAASIGNSMADASWAPLFYAAAGGYEAIVGLLLSSEKMDIDATDFFRRRTLSQAAAGGHEAIVKRLLDSGLVETDSKDLSERTALSHAAAKGHAATVQLLLELGRAEVDSRDRWGQTPLSHTAAEGHESTFRLLVKAGKAEINSKDNHGRTPFSKSAQRGHEVIVQLLWDSGHAEIDSRDTFGRTPLSLAAESGHKSVVKLLIDSGEVHVDSRDLGGRTPLSYAAAEGHESTLRILLETGEVDIDSKDNCGFTPLCWAAIGEHRDIIHLLLGAGKVDANLSGLSERMPLSWAEINSWGQESIASLLLDSGIAPQS